MATELLIVIQGTLIVHLYPNGTLFMLLTVYLWFELNQSQFNCIFTSYLAYVENSLSYGKCEATTQLKVIWK